MNYPCNQIASPLRLGARERQVLDQTYTFSKQYCWYCPDPPVLTPCPNCGNLLDWFDSYYECNWCCRTWTYEHMKQWALAGTNLSYPQGPEEGIQIKAYTCFDALPADQCHRIDDLLDKLVEVFWIERFIRQAKRKVVSKRDLAFCRFLYPCLADYFLNPHSFLWSRAESIYDSLSIFTSLLMYTSTDELIANLYSVGIRLTPRRALNHEWWKSKCIRYQTVEDAYAVFELITNHSLEEDLLGPRLAIEEEPRDC